MFWIIGGFIFSTVFILLIVYSRIYITTNFTYIEQDSKLIICVYFYHIRLLKRKVDFNNHMEKGIKSIFKNKPTSQNIGYVQRELHVFIRKINQLNHLATSLLKNIQIRKLIWHSKIGFEDAGTTGMFIGGIWTMKGTLIGFISRQSPLKCKPEISIVPSFQRQQLSTKLECIVSIRIGQAIYAFLKAMRKVPTKKEAYI